MSYTISFKVSCVETNDSIYDATQVLADWIEDNSHSLIYDVLDNETGKRYTVDLEQDEEDAVLPVSNTYTSDEEIQAFIQPLCEKKAEEDNRIDLDAYASGLIRAYKELKN